jgi:glycerate kinase
MNRFLIVPDKFKGCLNAAEVAQTMEQGIRDVMPGVSIARIPLADGGDGTGEILSRNLDAKIHYALVRDPLGRPVRASWGLRRKIAYLDMAAASGMALVPPPRRNPWHTSSFGTGQLLLSAARDGACQMILGVGGSATVDGGLGAMKALGIRFLDRNGREVAEGGKGLLQIRRIDTSSCALKETPVEIIILADVTNPLLGSRGAAPVFGPQKGATPAMVRALERGLRNMNSVILRQFGRSVAQIRSGGAAGGIVAGLVGVLNRVPGVRVRAVDGIDYVLEALGVKSAMRRADWVLTGEGHLDLQTAGGKTIQGVARLAHRLRKPVIAFAGKVSLNDSAMKRMGLRAAFTIAPGPCSLEESFRQAKPWLLNTVRNAVRLLTR